MKIIKKDCKSKQELNIENYQRRKKHKERIWNKWMSKHV